MTNSNALLAPPQIGFAKSDPYLLIAQATQFVDHFLERFDDITQVDLLVELAVSSHAEDLPKFATASTDVQLSTSHIDAGSMFVSCRMGQKSLNDLLSQSFVKRVELGQVLMPQRPVQSFDQQAKAVTTKAVLPPAASKTSTTSGERTLAAMIDHGCPFAHREYLRDGMKTRVVTIWDQDPIPEFASASGKPPVGFFAGREVTNATLQSWIDQAKSPDLSIDESRCYKLAGYSAMEQELTHGSHVMGLLVGRSYKRKNTNTDVAGDCDIAFVQLPRQAVETPSANAIHRCTLDGLRYLRNFAAKNEYTKCVVVCDYGSNLGPHDGTSLFERALDAFLAEKGVAFQIVFPSGNCRDEALHATLSPVDGKPATVAWNLRSNNETATYAELWIENTDSKAVTVTVQAGSHSIAVCADSLATGTPHWLNIVRQPQHDGQTQIVLRAAPTQVSDASTAKSPAVQVLITLTASSPLTSPVHAYLCWGGQNIGFPRRMQQAKWSVPEGMTGTVKIESSGSLLGSACGSHPEIYVIGGYVDHPNNPQLRSLAKYSCVGPSRFAHRTGPNFVAVSDESPSTPGVSGPGTRNAIVRNMWGTSVSAPQAARALINGQSLPTRSSATPGTAETIGTGYLD